MLPEAVDFFALGRQPAPAIASRNTLQPWRQGHRVSFPYPCTRRRQVPWRTSPTVLVPAGARECGSTNSSGKPRNPCLAHLAHAFPQYTRPCTHKPRSPPPFPP